MAFCSKLCMYQLWLPLFSSHRERIHSRKNQSPPLIELTSTLKNIDKKKKNRKKTKKILSVLPRRRPFLSTFILPCFILFYFFFSLKKNLHHLVLLSSYRLHESLTSKHRIFISRNMSPDAARLALIAFLTQI